MMFNHQRHGKDTECTQTKMYQYYAHCHRKNYQQLPYCVQTRVGKMAKITCQKNITVKMKKTYPPMVLLLSSKTFLIHCP